MVERKREKQPKKRILTPKISPVGKVILSSIAVAGTISLFALLPGLGHIIGPLLKKRKYSTKQSITRNLASLVRTGLVKRSISKEGKVQLSLTTKGKWEAFLRQAEFKDAKDKKWNGVWRVVIFDVPVTKNKLRRELRRAMMLYGFKMLQQSVWVYPYACDDFIALLKAHLGVANDVLYMKVSYIENDKHLKKEFGIV